MTLDDSMGPAGPLPGPEFQIEARFGRQVGTNLFHSFRVFNLNAAESATFTDVGATDSIENILGRVTGGASNIDGAIRTRFQSSAPNLFLLNPAGLVFGPNATLDVQGSFHASTADSIKLADGVQFDAVVPTANDALLTSAPPSAFGFLPSDQSELTQPELTVSGSELRVPAGESISLVGKSDPTTISLPGQPPLVLPPSVKVRVESGILDAPEGRADVIQARSNSEVSIEKPNSPPLPERDLIRPANFSKSEDVLVRTGMFTVTGGATVGKEGGNITVDVAKLALRDGGLLDTSAGSGNAGDIEINATDSVSLTGRLQSFIGADV
ncbi:MAG: filamentous hemagglutinin N-terminal domain-containing protein, partial [Acidimicrobiia bacterium]